MMTRTILSTNEGSVHRRGFSLVEVTLATLIAGLVLATCVKWLGTSFLQQRHQYENQQAVFLARSLCDEILKKAYKEPSGGSTLGPDTGESNRYAYDDVDDFNGWSESPIHNAIGTEIPNTDTWTASVTVIRVDPDDPHSFSFTEKGMKFILVEIAVDGRTAARFGAIRCDVDDQLD